MNTIIINGQRIDVVGNQIRTVTKGDSTDIYVNNGVVFTTQAHDIKISFEGDLASLDATNVVINGDVQGNVDSTNLTCKDINGDVDATNVRANIITGKVKATNVRYS